MDRINWSEYFYYDETSPTCLRWKVDRFAGKNHSTKMVSKDDVAGWFASRQNGKPKAIEVGLNKKSYLVHRIIWELLIETIPSTLVIDHLNGNPFDNKISNLFVKTQNHNCQNKFLRVDSSTKVTGVSFNKTKNGTCYYRAYWCDLNGKQKFKSFSCKKLGTEIAFESACKYREDRLKELNSLGAGYTERHGT